MTIDRALLGRVAELILQAETKIQDMMSALRHGSQDAIVTKGTIGSGTTDYVTQIDTEVEIMMLAQLRLLIPGSFAVGEESFDADRDDNLEKASQGYAWILDPLDGTNNVVAYLKSETDAPPAFGVMAALLHDGKPVAGWVMTSDNDNQKRLFCGATGIGAFEYDHGILSSLCLAPSGRDTPHVVTTVPAWAPELGARITVNANRNCFTLHAPPKSAAHEVMLLLSGVVDASAFRQFRLWDHLPGAVIVEAAGGQALMLSGRKPVLADQRQDGLIMSGPSFSNEAIRQALLGDNQPQAKPA